MITDHLGYYFFPDHLWLRAVGRACVPIWFFLIGYAHSRTIDRRLIVGALILLAADALLGRSLLPLNVLVTMILLRLAIDPLMRRIKGDALVLATVTVLFYLLFPLTNMLWEYGTLAMMFAVCGYLARNGFDGDDKVPRLHALFCLIAFVVTQHEVFRFPPLSDALNALGSAVTLTALMFYLPRRTDIGFRLDNPLAKKVLRFLGNRTLEIYVVHLVLFKIALYLLSGSLCACRMGA